MRPNAPETRSILSLVALAGLLVLVLPSDDAVAQASRLAALSGRWELVDPQRQRRAVRREVDRVVDQMGFLIRGIARGRVREEIRPSNRLVMSWLDGERFVLRIGAKRPETCRADGRSRRTPDGEATVSCRVDGARLVRRSVLEDGAQVAIFRIGPDGETLRVSVRVTSRHLPEAIAYELTYRRSS